ncbi:MAG: response regulator [Pseudomonadales bacterium]
MSLIYLVDDEPLVTRVLQRGLQKQGYTVQVFHDGHDVLEAVAQQAPAALVTDIEMPLMTGRVLTETLCSRYPERRFPIFILTSATDLVHREWSGVLPNVLFLEKPVSMRQLSAQLAEKINHAA